MRTYIASFVFVIGIAGPEPVMAKQVTWALYGPVKAEISVRRAVAGRTENWTTYRTAVIDGRVEVTIDLKPRREGYDVSIQPLDKYDRPTQEPLNSKEPILWEDLSSTTEVILAEETGD